MKTKPETTEFEPSIDACYVRFRTAKVAKTTCEDKPGPEELATYRLEQKYDVEQAKKNLAAFLETLKTHDKK